MDTVTNWLRSRIRQRTSAAAAASTASEEGAVQGQEGVPQLQHEMKKEWVPLLMVLFIKLAYEFLTASLSVLILALCLSHLQGRLQMELDLRRSGNRGLAEIFGLFIVVLSLISTMSLLTSMNMMRPGVWTGLVFVRSDSNYNNDLSSVLLDVVSTDVACQLCVLFLQIGVATVVATWNAAIQCNARHTCLTQAILAIQHGGILYRLLLPLPIYMRYYGTGTTLTFMYVFAKSSQFLALLTAVFQHYQLADLIKFEDSFTILSEAELLEEGRDPCPICLGRHQSAVKLSCTHIFCRACISEWLEKNAHTNSCPICRVSVVGGPQWEKMKQLRQWESSCLPVVF